MSWLGKDAVTRRKAILGTAYEFATGQRLGSSDFEGGKTGAVRVLGHLGFVVKEKGRPAK
jgi:predicted deacylase